MYVTITSEAIKEVLDQVTKGLTDVGFVVVSVATDGHKTNVRFHNEQSSRSNPLYTIQIVLIQILVYLLYDTVPLFKKFYNNLMNMKTLHFPPFAGTNHKVPANFYHLNKSAVSDHCGALKYSTC